MPIPCHATADRGGHGSELGGTPRSLRVPRTCAATVWSRDRAHVAGTIRTFDAKVRDDIIDRMRRTSENIAAASGAQATLSVNDDPNPAVINDPRLSERVLPSLRAMAGSERVKIAPLQTIAEDFSGEFGGPARVSAGWMRRKQGTRAHQSQERILV